MKALIILLLIIPGMMLNGFVTVQLWNWFIIPNFNAPAITLPAAIGIHLVFHNIKGASVKHKDHEIDNDAGIVAMFLTPLLLWFVGWVVVTVP
jgi:hypothetical protein